jgi:hypothetical protein
MTKQTDREIAQLKKEIAELKAAQPKSADPPGSRLLTKEEQDAWSREMDALRHRNESYVPPWLREACAGGVSDRDARAIAGTARAPTGPSAMAPSSPPVTGTRRGVAGNGTGWAHSAPLGPPPGVAQADRLMDAQDAKDKAERIREQAQLQSMDRIEALHTKLAEGKK